MNEQAVHCVDRSIEGRDTRFGMVLCLGSAVVSVKMMIWLATAAAYIVMQ